MKDYKPIYYSILVFTLLFFGSLYIYDDLRHDEALSLNSFALQDFSRTATYYPEPNNHFFFNIVNNIFSRAIGVRDIHTALDYIYVFRLLQLLVAFGSLYFLYLYVKHFFDENTAWISAIIFITTIPFLIFMMQLRGYNFSIFFAITILYYTSLYLEEQRKHQLLLSGIFSFLLLYTVPSNLYYYLSLLILVGISWAYNFHKNPQLSFRKRVVGIGLNRGPALVGLSTLFVVTFTVIAYIPAFETLLNAKTTTQHPDYRFFVLTERLPEVMNFMVSGRELLLGLALAGIFGMYQIKRWRIFQRWSQILFLLFMPFVFSFLRNDLPLQRTFVVLVPIFSIALAIPLNAFLTSLKLRNRDYPIALLSIYVFCIFTCWNQLNHIQIKLDENLKNAVRERGIYYNFYQSDSYKMLEAAKSIEEAYQKEKLPVLVMPRTLDATAFIHYLDKYDLTNYSLQFKAKEKSDKNGSIIHIRSSFPDAQQGKVKKSFIKHRGKKRHIPREINQTLALVNFLKTKEHGNDFYAVHSFHKTFIREIKPYLKKEYEIKKLSKGQGSFNVYRFRKRKK